MILVLSYIRGPIGIQGEAGQPGEEGPTGAVR
jgi:hypothetical protein